MCITQIHPSEEAPDILSTSYICALFKHPPSLVNAVSMNESEALLVGLPALHKLESPGKREAQLAIASIRLYCGNVCGAFSQFMMGVRWFTWVGGPGLNKKDSFE